MLTFESLMEEAKSAGLPATKKRAVVREYLQLLILKTIYRSAFGRDLYFTGGTALRLLYQLPRFSEDLDFDASSLSQASFTKLLNFIQTDLAQEGFQSELQHKAVRRIFRGAVKLTNALQSYGLTPLPGEKLSIKIEIYCPAWKLEGRSEILQGFGLAFPCLVLKESELLAEKITALINRKRARDIYDLFFMLRRNFPLDPEVLRSRGLSPSIEEKLRESLGRFKSDELKQCRKQLLPFLFLEEEGVWIEEAPKYLEAFLRKRTALH